ncbi:UNVERIFIED_CONTAM: hypothetical protein K2H54_037203 [Gekko kuhli]
MSKIRKLFRGSGRALALIFVASVLWLLFDMAALKFSFSEINTQVLKEEISRRERGRGGPRNPEQSPDGAGEEPRLSPGGLGRDQKYYRYKGGEDAAGAELHEEKEPQKREDKKPATSKPAPKKMMVLHRVIPLKLWSLQPSVPLREKVRGNLEGEVNSTSLPRTKLALPGGIQQTQSAAAVSRPLVRVTHSAATVGSKVTQRAHRPSPEDSRGRKEVLLKVGLVDKGSLAGLKQELPTGSKSEKSQARPFVLGAPVFSVNETGGKGKPRNVYNITKNLDLPVREPATTKAVEKGTASAKATGPGQRPKDDAKKEVPSLEDQVVFISKDGAQTPAKQMLRADAKGNVTNRLIGNNVPGMDSKSKTSLKESNVTKTATSSKTVLVKATVLGKVHKVNLADKDQLRKINQNDSLIPLVGSPQMHKVLTIDRTIAPRDPRAVGQFGRPAVVPREKQEESKRRWNEGNFNVYLSDLIPVDRAIEDTRPSGPLVRHHYSRLKDMGN